MPAMKLKNATDLWPLRAASTSRSDSSSNLGEVTAPSVRLSGTEAMRRNSLSAWSITKRPRARPSPAIVSLTRSANARRRCS